MKKNLLPFRYILLLFILINFSACQDEAKKEDTTAQESTEGAADEKAITVNPAHGMPGHTCQLPVGAPLNSLPEKTTPVSQLPSTSVSPIRIDQTPDVNPPHGQPGHICSIPVGAPLE
ncbi:MAG TPA: hypothetical protein VFM60_05160 [Salinimicrobium sp.]|nr:hypothetical protein [Salinimicrobium sp.]